MDRRRAGALLALAACVACTAAAPTASDHTALDLYDGGAEGCFYNFQHYGEGDRIMTNEPCLNCTCHNRMLMCYLRVCPFTKPIGQDCTVEKRADQCCPIVTCPDVPVDLLTSTSTTSPAEYGATGLGKLDKYGCSIEGKYFPEGSKVPPTPNKPCEHCYCIRNMTTCVMQECTLHVDGCTPIYHKDVCCPVRYSCDHPEDEMPLLDDMSTTVRPTPGFLLTTTTIAPVTQMTQDCVHDDQIFADGALIKTEKACEHCYCMKGDIVCVVQECGTPMENEGKNCTSLPPREGQCCPDTYICEGDDLSTESTTETEFDAITTLSPPRRSSIEGSGYRKEADEATTFTKMPTQQPEYEGSGEEQTTVQPADELEKDEQPAEEIHKLSTISEVPSEIDQPKATTEPSIIDATSEKIDESNLDKDESSLPVTIEPQEYIPAATSGFADKEDETTEDYLMTAEPEDLASHHHMPSSAVTEKYNDISTDAGEDMNTVPIEENLEPHKQLPTSDDVDKETEKSTPSIVEKQTEPEERVSSTSTFAESTESTKLVESDVTTKTEMYDLEKDVPSTVGTITDEVEKETIKMHDATTASYPSSAQSVAVDEYAKSTTEPDHSQNTVMTAEEDDVAGTKPSDKVKENTTPQSVESGSGEEDIDEDNLVVPHEHGTTILPSQLEDVATTVEREIELPGKPSDSDETEYKTTIQSSTSPTLTTAIKGDQSTITTEPSFRKEDKIAVTSEKSDQPEVTTSKSDLTEEEFIPASPHDEKISTGVLVTDDETSTLQPDYVIDTKEPTITSSTEYSILTETKPSTASEQESELEPETPGSGSLPDITTEVSDIEVHHEPSRIPGEGDCLLDSITYTNNSRVPSNNKCYSGCKCVSSIIKCDPIICSPPPDYMHNCQSIYDTPDSCCPTYVCDHPRETAPPQSDNQMSVTESPITSSSIECRGDQCEIITHTKKPEITESDKCGPQGCEGEEIKPADTQLPSDHSDKCQGDECGISSTDCSNGDCKSPQVPDQICDPEHGCQATPVRPCEGELCKDTIEQPAPVFPTECEKATGCEDGKTQQTAVPSSETQQESCKDDQNCTQQPQKEKECTEESCKKTETVPLEEQIMSECKDDQCVHKLGTNINEIVDSKEPSPDQSTTLLDIGTTPIPINSDASEVYDSQDTTTKKDKPYEIETEKTQETDKDDSQLTTVTAKITENIYPTEPSDILKETYTSIPKQPITDLEHEIPSEEYQTTISDVSGQAATTTSYKTDIVETTTLSQDVTSSKPSEIPLPSHTDGQKEDSTAVPEDINYATEHTSQYDLDNKQYTTTLPGDEKTTKTEENLYTTVRQEPSQEVENKDTSEINEIVTTQKSVSDETYESSTVTLPSENEQDTDNLVTISAENPVTDGIISHIPTVEPMTTNSESVTLSSAEQEKITTEVSKLEPHVTKPQESSETHEFTTKSSNVFEVTTEVEAIATKSPEVYVTEGLIPEKPQTEQQHITEITTSATKPDETYTEIEDSFVTGSEDVTTERLGSGIYEKPKPTTTVISDVTGSQEISTKADIVPDEYITVTPSIPHVDKFDDSITDSLEPLLPTKNIIETESPEYITRKPDTTITETVQSTEKSDLVHKSTEQISESEQSTEALITEQLIPVEPVKTNIPEKTPMTPGAEDNEINVPQGPEIDTTDEPETDTEEPVSMSPEKEYSEIPLENITELPQKTPEEIDSHKINTDVPSYITSEEVTPESDIKLQESFTEKQPIQTTDATVDEMRTELPIDQEPVTLVTLSQNDGATPYIPHDKLSTESPKETVADKGELPSSTTVFISEEITKSPLKESEDKTVTVTSEEPKPDSGSPVYESATKPSVYDITTTVTEIPETKPSEDETQTPKPSKESDIKTTTQQEKVTSASESTGQPEVSKKEETTQSIIEQEDQTTKAPGDSVTTESEDASLNVQSEKDDVTKSPNKDDEQDMPNILESTTLDGHGPDTLDTQEDLVTKIPEFTGPVTSEGPTEEKIIVIPDSSKSDDVATKLPEYTGMTAIEVTKQEEVATASIQEATVTRSPEYTDVPEDENLTKTPDSVTPEHEESDINVTTKEEQVTQKPQDESLSSVTESVATITSILETTVGYDAHITQQSVVTTVDEQIVTESPGKITESQDIPKDTINETPGKPEDPEIIVTVQPDVTPKTPEVMKDPESLVTGQEDIIISTALPGTDNKEPVTNDTRRQELDTASQENANLPDNDIIKQSEKPEDETMPETNVELTSQYHGNQDEVTDTYKPGQEIPVTISPVDTKYAEATESTKDTTEKEHIDIVTEVPDTTEQISSEEHVSTKSPEYTKYVDMEVTSQDSLVTKSPEYGSDITKEYEHATKMPGLGEESDVSSQEEYLPEKLDTEAPIIDMVTEKQPPYDEITTEQLEDIQTTPELVILEEHTHKPALDSLSTLPPFEEDATTLIDEMKQHMPETTHIPPIKSPAEEKTPTTFEPKPTIYSEHTISTDSEDKEISTPSSLVPQDSEKSPIADNEKEVQSETIPLTTEYPPTSESTHDGLTIQPTTERQEEKLITPGLNIITPSEDKSDEFKPSEDKPSEDTLSEGKPSEDKSTESKLTDEQPGEGKPSEEIPSEDKTGEGKPSEEIPSEDETGEGKPSEESPSEESPKEDKTGEGKPSEESPKPSEDKTSDIIPTEEKPDEHKPTEEKPTEDKTGEDKPSEESPSEEKPTDDKTGEGKPSKEKPSDDKTAEDKPSEEKPTEDKMGEGKPSEEGPSEGEPSEDKTGEDKPSEQKPTEDESGEIKPSEEMPSEEKPSDGKPTEESSSEEKPNEDKTGEGKPSEEIPSEGSQSEEKPSEESPIEGKPSEETPSEEKPSEEIPSEEIPSEGKPSEDTPTEDKTGEGKPTEESPSEEKPIEDKTGEDKPSEEKPTEDKTGEGKPSEEIPSEGIPSEEIPSEGKPSEEKPSEEKPSEDKTAEDKPSEEIPSEGKPSEEKPSDDETGEDKPSEESPSEEKPTEDKTGEDKPSEEKPSEEKPSEDKTAEDKPSEEIPSEGKPSEENPSEDETGEDKPSEEKPTEDKKSGDKSSEEKPTEDKTGESKPSEESPSEEIPIEGKPIEEKPSEDETGEGKPSEDTPTEDKTGESKPSKEKPSDDETGEGKPGEEKPTEDKTGEDKPSEEKPSEDQTAEDKPSEEKPTEDKTGEDKPSEESPSEEKPTEDKTGEDKPSEEKPTEDKTGEGKPSEEIPSEGKPSEEKPSEDETGEDKPSEEKPTDDKTGEGKPSEESPSEEKPSEDQTAEDKPSEEKPTEDKTGEDKPSEEKPSEDKTAEDKPSEESPSEEKPSEDQTAEDKPSEEKPTEDKTGEDKPSEEKPTEDKTGEGKPSEEKPSEDNTAEDKPSEEKPTEDKTGEGKPNAESPSEEKPTEDKTGEIKPSEDIPTEDKTSESKPSEEKPSEEKPTEDKTAEDKPSEESPSEEKPADDKTGEIKPSEDIPTEDKTSESKPSEEKPTEDKTGEKPIAGMPAEEKPNEPSEPTAETPKPITSAPQATDELPTPEEDGYFPPSGMGYGEPDESEDDQAFGPGTCRYGGKVYVSAQQIPRDDPCDFCFCFRSDIICLQQSCPPPIHGCHEEPIQGFCCPRYECPVSMATTVNVTTTTTTTTTTLPPHFPTHSYKGAAQRRGCQIKGHTYKVGEVVRSASGPCLHCTCGGDGQMKCDPKACTPEPMLRQMIAAAVSAKRRR